MHLLRGLDRALARGDHLRADAGKRKGKKPDPEIGLHRFDTGVRVLIQIVYLSRSG